MIFSRKCKHDLFKEPLIVSGRGLTQYEINFCKKCARLFWRLTIDGDNIYPKYNDKKWR